MNNSATDKINTDDEHGTHINITDSGFGPIKLLEKPNDSLIQDGTSVDEPPGINPNYPQWNERFWGSLYELLEKKLPFTIILLSLIGYVVINAFGQMGDFHRYGRYLLFLALLCFFYKHQTKKRQNENTQYGAFEWFFIVGFVALFGILMLLIIYNWQFIISVIAKTMCGV